jgi:hypothetical protein
MAGPVTSNTPIKTNSETALPATPTTWTDKVSSVAQRLVGQLPESVQKHVFSKPDKPSVSLDKIRDVSKNGLGSVAPKGIHPRPIEIDMEEQFTAALPKVKVNKPSAPKRMEGDPDATRPLDLKAKKENTNWKLKKEQNQKDLTDKISIYSTLVEMSKRCGIKTENFELMNLVKLATTKEIGKPAPSVWKLFVEKLKPSFTQKIKAGWFYFWYYKTWFITNVVETYVNRFIETVTRKLNGTKEERAALFQDWIHNAQAFLIDDRKATEQFATGKGSGTLGDHRQRAIDKAHGNQSFEELCRKFAENWVDKDAPEVPFFTTFKNLPLVGWFFRGLQTLINRFIIQRTMSSSILPEVTRSVVKKGLEATEPHNLPFSISLTRFLTTQLGNLRDELERGENIGAVPPLPGTEELGSTVHALLSVLDVEECKNKDELIAKLAALKQSKGSVDKEIELGITRGGHFLFEYLKKTAETHELFANLLELAAEPFSRELNQKDLLAEYEKEQELLVATREEVVQKLIDTSIKQALEEVTDGSKPEKVKQAAENSFEAKKAITKKTVDQLSKLCGSIDDKIRKSAQGVTPETDIHPDLATTLKMLQLFATQTTVKEELKQLTEVDKNAIWQVVSPIYKQVGQITDQIAQLQNDQNDYISYELNETHLQIIGVAFTSLQAAIESTPSHLPSMETLFASVEIIKESLGTESPIYKKLKPSIDGFVSSATKIVEEQTKIDTLNELARSIKALGDYYQPGSPRQPGFKPSACRQMIQRHLEHFQDLQGPITALIGEGSKIRGNLDALTRILQPVLDQSTGVQTSERTKMTQERSTISPWALEKSRFYGSEKGKQHTKMLKTIAQVSADVQSLKVAIDNAQLKLPAPLTETDKQSIGATIATSIPALAWLLGGSGAVGALAGVGVAAYRGYRNWPQHSKTSYAEWAKTVSLGILTGGAAYFTGGLGAAAVSAAAGHAGATYKEHIHTVVPEHYALSKTLNDIADKTHKLLLDKRIWEAAATRILFAMGQKTKK